MFRLIGLLVVLALGFGGGLAWEARPPIGWHLNLLIWHPGFSLPDGWKTQRDKALSAGALAATNLKTCQDNTSSLKAAVERQNSAVEALQREGEARTAESRRAVSAARAVAESYRQNADRILATQPTDPDRCKAADVLIMQEAGR